MISALDSAAVIAEYTVLICDTGKASARKTQGLYYMYAIKASYEQ